jgi:hypothetical protein
MSQLQRLSLAEFSKLQGQVQTWGDKSTALSKELEAHKASADGTMCVLD